MHPHQVSGFILTNFCIQIQTLCVVDITNHLPHITFRACPPPYRVFFLSSADDGLVTGLPESVARLPGEEAEEAHQGGQAPGAQHCDHTELRSVRSLLWLKYSLSIFSTSEYHNPFPSKVCARQNINVFTVFPFSWINVKIHPIYWSIICFTTQDHFTGLVGIWDDGPFACHWPGFEFSASHLLIGDWCRGRSGRRARARQMLVNTEPEPGGQEIGSYTSLSTVRRKVNFKIDFQASNFILQSLKASTGSLYLNTTCSIQAKS